jgi:hypothetical protein
MIKRLINRFKFFISPPKKGDIFVGDPLQFVISKNVEYVLFELKDKYGKLIWTPIPSFGCFKLLIANNSMDNYYICEASVLCEDCLFNKKIWKIRNQPKRISKYLFRDLVLHGVLKKEIR